MHITLPIVVITCQLHELQQACTPASNRTSSRANKSTIFACAFRSSEHLELSAHETYCQNTNMVDSLFKIAQSVCVKQASRIVDIGDTPYHLVQPILRRLTAKQLALLEDNCPSVTPHSDELWASLIEKDFTDRPVSSVKTQLTANDSNSNMPNKQLYFRYQSEKEEFLATSALRLRKMTDRLRKEKSRNSIVPLQELLADPTIRRRSSYIPQVRGQSNAKSILGKARKDVSQRSLMFGGISRRPITNKHLRQPASKHHKPDFVKMEPKFSIAYSQSTSSNNLHRRGPTSVVSQGGTGSTEFVPGNTDKRDVHHTSAKAAMIQSPDTHSTTSHTPHDLRRSQTPNVFLSPRKRRKTVPPNPSTGSKNQHTNQIPHSQIVDKPKKMVKSSIFH